MMNGTIVQTHMGSFPFRMEMTIFWRLVKILWIYRDSRMMRVKKMSRRDRTRTINHNRESRITKKTSKKTTTPTQPNNQPSAN